MTSFNNIYDINSTNNNNIIDNTYKMSNIFSNFFPFKEPTVAIGKDKLWFKEPTVAIQEDKLNR